MAIPLDGSPVHIPSYWIITAVYINISYLNYPWEDIRRQTNAIEIVENALIDDWESKRKRVHIKLW